MGSSHLDKCKKLLPLICVNCLVSLAVVLATLSIMRRATGGNHVSRAMAPLPRIEFTARSYRAELWPFCPQVDWENPFTEGCGFFTQRTMRFGQPTRQSRETFEAEIHQPSWYDEAETTPLPCRPLSDAQYARLDAALEYYQASRIPTDGWRWNQVEEALFQIGTEALPACIERGRDRHGSYDFGLHHIELSRDLLRDSPEQIVPVLIHEATHAVYAEALREMAGLERNEFARALTRCGDLREVERISTEALAFVNERLWSRLNVPPTDPRARRHMDAAVAGWRGNLHDQLLFAQDMQMYQIAAYDLPDLQRHLHTHNRDRPEDQRATSLACGPFVRVDPDRSAHYVFPTDVEPEFLTAVQELRELELDDICLLDDLQLEWDHPCWEIHEPWRIYGHQD